MLSYLIKPENLKESIKHQSHFPFNRKGEKGVNMNFSISRMKQK